MASFTVHKGKRYQAIVHLGFVQRLASNDMVADEFREVGFTDVTVTGSGRERMVIGSWPLKDTSADIPSEVTSIKEIPVIEV